jgi:hypothetical protein
MSRQEAKCLISKCANNLSSGSNEYNFSYIYVRVAAVYGITGVTGVEANTDYSVLHTGNTVFFVVFSVIKNKFSKNG